MYFNPVDRFNKLSVDRYNTVPNKYSEMTYSLKLTKYFENIFPIIFSTNKDIENTLVTNMGKLSMSPEIGALWLQALYKKEGLDKITKEQYKDYVELASALDWIDGDTSSNGA